MPLVTRTWEVGPRSLLIVGLVVRSVIRHIDLAAAARRLACAFDPYSSDVVCPSLGPTVAATDLELAASVDHLELLAEDVDPEIRIFGRLQGARVTGCYLCPDHADLGFRVGEGRVRMVAVAVRMALVALAELLFDHSADVVKALELLQDRTSALSLLR